MASDPLFQVAAQLQRSREARNDVFGADAAGFGDPAWDMLVDLFLTDARNERATASELVTRDHVEAATGRVYLRWLATRGLVTIAGDDVSLDERGRELMHSYLQHEAVTGKDGERDAASVETQRRERRFEHERRDL